MKDCFAYNSLKKRPCGLLVGGKCNGKCSFYKTVPQIMREQERLYSRIAAMPTMRQIIISEKYYDGKMPWKDGNVCEC